MATSYRAKVGFSCPADPESLKRRLAALKLEPGEAKDRALGKVEWMVVEKGDKVTSPHDFVLKDWLQRGLVEEVKS
jgi:hypothetical protein